MGSRPSTRPKLLTVSDAVQQRHSAPWSVADQASATSPRLHQLSPANAKWFYGQLGSGDPVVKNSVGTYNKNDGAQD